MAGKSKRSWSIMAAIVAANIALVVCVVISVVSAFNRAEEISFKQNIENIRTLTDASAEKVELEFLHHTHEIQRIANYISQYNGVGMTEAEMQNLFEQMYSIPEKACHWELADSSTGDSMRFSATSWDASKKTKFLYDAESYPELARIFCSASEESLGKVNYTAEFTDPSPTLDKVTAITCSVRLRSESGYEYKTLMLLLKSGYLSNLLSAINTVDTLDYFDFSNIIIDNDGNYVISTPQFQGTNFLNYIELYNNSFSEEDKGALLAQLHNEDYTDVLFYDNNRNQACAYTITPVQNSNWHILSIVPLDSFHSEYHFGNGFLTFAIFFSLLFAMDVTVVAFINQKLRRKTIEAQAASVAKTDFLSRMSHDMRTPLNVIIGMNHLAQENDNPKDTNDCLNKIDVSSEFLLGLINDVLDLERIESGKIQLSYVPYSSNEFAEYISSVIRPLCEQKSIHFDYSIDTPDDFVIMQDKLRTNQVYFNLLSNAVKFTPEGGTIVFHTVAAKEENRFLLDVTISDTGIGMSDEFQTHMFESFTQENRDGSSGSVGSGLGLAIVKHLCDLMGMTITVKSELGHGTTFYLHGEFDLAPAQLSRTNVSEIGLDDEQLAGKTILICEDHPLNQEIAKRLLEKKGIICLLAEDGKRGLEIFGSSKIGSISAILMDIRMPVMDGLQATREIRDLDRADSNVVPIIALSANAYDEDVHKCIEAGMNAHLAKPYSPNALYSVLADQINAAKQQGAE